MTIVHKFEYVWPEGVQQIGMNEWLQTLTPEEQEEYRLGRENGDKLRQVAIDQGKLFIDKNGYYRWKDQAAFKENKQNDECWEKYWRRWQQETGVKFLSTVEEE